MNLNNEMERVVRDMVEKQLDHATACINEGLAQLKIPMRVERPVIADRDVPKLWLRMSQYPMHDNEFLSACRILHAIIQNPSSTAFNLLNAVQGGKTNTAIFLIMMATVYFTMGD